MERLLNNNKRKAFTLIELLVVIAIIGILSGAVIVAMSGTQESATDSRIKVSMDQLRSSIEIYALLNGSNYAELESDREVSLLLSDIVSQGVTPTIDVSASGDKYCLSADLKSSNDKWCIDSTGFAGIGDCLSQACNYALGEGGGEEEEEEEDIPVVWSCGNDFVDPRDSNVYSTVQIGDQCWMAENLNYETGTSWCYGNYSVNCDIYGRLYNWDTANIACPAGWHLPTDVEWYTLESLLATGPCSATRVGWACFPAGVALKHGGVTGYNVLLSGYRTNTGEWLLPNYSACFWAWAESSSGTTTAWYRGFDADHDNVYRANLNKGFGFSLRCLRDYP